MGAEGKARVVVKKSCQALQGMSFAAVYKTC